MPANQGTPPAAQEQQNQAAVVSPTLTNQQPEALLPSAIRVEEDAVAPTDASALAGLAESVRRLTPS